LFTQLGVPSEAYFIARSQNSLSPFYGLNASAIWSHTFALPSYLHRDVCLQYKSSCAGIIALAPALDVNCTEQNEDGVRTFPSSTQAVVSMTLSGSSLSLSTAPNPLNLSQATYTSQCPPRFEVPEHPNDDRNILIPLSDCAMACPYPIYSEEEDSINRDFLKYVPYFGSIPALLVIGLARTQWVTFCFTFVALACFTFGLSGYVDNYEEHHCSSNTTFQSVEKDGFSPCVIQSMVFQASLNLSCFFWVSGCKEVSTSKPMSKLEILGNFFLAFLLLLIGYLQGSFGFRKTDVACFTSDSFENSDAFILAVPNSIALFLGLWLLLRNQKPLHEVLADLGREQEGYGDEEEGIGQKKKGNSSGRVKFFTLCTIIAMCIAGSMIMRLVLFVRYDINESNLEDWVRCMFLEFDSSSTKKSIYNICGDRMMERMPLNSVYVMFIVRLFIPPFCVLGAWMDLSAHKGNTYQLQSKVVPTNDED
jgi:hypothetical protein